MKFIRFNNLKEYSVFFWLILVALLFVIISIIHTSNKNDNALQIENSLKNIYLKKILFEITNNLEPRFIKITYISKTGDNYQSIINNLDIRKSEKKIILNSISNEKSLKILNINQKFIFRIDKLTDEVKQFKIQTDKKNEILFSRVENNEKYEVGKKCSKRHK